MLGAGAPTRRCWNAPEVRGRLDSATAVMNRSLIQGLSKQALLVKASATGDRYEAKVAAMYRACRTCPDVDGRDGWPREFLLIQWPILRILMKPGLDKRQDGPCAIHASFTREL
jgi:hypothetical protein